MKQVYSYEKALAYVQEMKQATEKDILLPVLVCNNGNRIRTAKYEYLIIEKVKKDNFCGYSLLRNDYGELVPHEVKDASDGQKTWKIVYKTDMLIEEVFKVNGVDEKKCCRWIFENLIKKQLEDGAMFCKIAIHGVCLVFDYDGSLQTVTTKCKSEAIRLYNKLQEMAEKGRMNRILWCGIKKLAK